MGIALCQIYNDNKGSLNTWVNGHYRPQAFEFDLYMATMEVFNEARRDWENSQVITDKNRSFFKNAQLGISPTGMIAYPTDYVSFSSLRFFSKTEDGNGVLCKDFGKIDNGEYRELTEEEKVEAIAEPELFEHTITKVSNDRWGAVMEDLIVGPSLENPYSTQLEGGFRIRPKDIGTVVLNYLKAPKRPLFLYKRNMATDSLECLPGSTEFEFGPEVLPEIMSRIKAKYSSSMGDQQKYAEAAKETSSAV